MQSILTSAINIIVLSFLVVMMLDFVVGLFLSMPKAEAIIIKPAVTRQSSQTLSKQLITEQCLTPKSTLKDPLPDPWISLVDDELSQVKDKQPKETNSNPVAKSPDRLTFEQVCADFAKDGFKLERYRSGRHKYRVTMSGGSPFQFKKLQEALNWLTSEQVLK